MKICIINNLFPPFSRGGAEIVVSNQASQLSGQGHDVFVITSRPIFNKTNKQKNIYRFYPLNIFSFYYLNKYPAVMRAIWRLVDIFNIHSYFKIKSILKKEKPTMVLAHNLTGLGYLSPLAIKKSKTKYIQLMHDAALIRPSGLLTIGQEKETVAIKLYFKITKLLFGSPDEVIFPSQWLKKYYTSHNFFPQSKKIIKRNFELNNKDILLNKKPKNKHKINFLFAGQIEEHKGILLLINSLNKIKESSYSLNILGVGSKLDQAKKLAAHNKNIKFYGYQKIDKYLQEADYTIVPSLCYENSPTIIFESLKANVPVIAANLGGIPELIQNKKNGYLFTPASENDLIKILKNVIINKQ